MTGSEPSSFPEPRLRMCRRSGKWKVAIKRLDRSTAWVNTQTGDRDRALERLQAEITRAPDKESSSTHPSIVVLSGLNVRSQMVLMGRDLIIRLFRVLPRENWL